MDRRLTASLGRDRAKLDLPIAIRGEQQNVSAEGARVTLERAFVGAQANHRAGELTARGRGVG